MSLGAVKLTLLPYERRLRVTPQLHINSVVFYQWRSAHESRPAHFKAMAERVYVGKFNFLPAPFQL